MYNQHKPDRILIYEVIWVTWKMLYKNTITFTYQFGYKASTVGDFTVFDKLTVFGKSASKTYQNFETMHHTVIYLWVNCEEKRQKEISGQNIKFNIYLGKKNDFLIWPLITFLHSICTGGRININESQCKKTYQIG